MKVEDRNYHTWTLDYIRGSERYDCDSGEFITESYKVPVKPLSGEIPFDYQGSIMSQIKESQLPKELRELKKFFVDLHALDLLAPELLRQRTRDAGNSLGLGGEKLSAFIHSSGTSIYYHYVLAGKVSLFKSSLEIRSSERKLDM